MDSFGGYEDLMEGSTAALLPTAFTPTKRLKCDEFSVKTRSFENYCFRNELKHS